MLRRPPRGLIAPLVIPKSRANITGRSTPGRGHWSLWGEPADFLRCVRYHPLLPIET
jgi:hypothetical protein